MSNPLVPNYKKNVGRLVTDRYDFEDHVNGANFRHNADNIDLNPALSINSVPVNNVQSALNELSLVAFPPSIPDATSTTKGILKINGDISGTADSVTVSKLQGSPVSTLAPTLNQSLVWNGTAWEAQTLSVFAPGGDLSGNAILQSVVGLTGASGIVNSSANEIRFNTSTTPIFSQDSTGSGNGANFTIKAQRSTDPIGNGGKISLIGGQGNALNGGVSLAINSTSQTMLDVTEVSPGRRAIGLFNGSPVTAIQLPPNTGDKVLFIGDTGIPPTTGSPLGGSILYSESGQLKVKQSDGKSFTLGVSPEIIEWESAAGFVFTYGNADISNSNIPCELFSHSMGTNDIIKIDVLIMGKELATGDSYQANLSIGFVTDSFLNVTSIGTITISDVRTTGGAVMWSLPSITNPSGSIIKLLSGYQTGINIRWASVTQLWIGKI